RRGRDGSGSWVVVFGALQPGVVLMPRDVRARQNMDFFRQVNERTQQAEGHWLSEQSIAFVCECANLGCRAPVYLPGEEFRRVREIDGQYIIVGDHIDPNGERVVVVTGDHAVVTQIDAEERPAPDGREIDAPWTRTRSHGGQAHEGPTR